MFRISRQALPVLALVVLLITACQPQVVTKTVEVEVTKEVPVVITATPQPAAEAETIRIGGVGPLSSPGYVIGGIAMQYTMNLAVKDINAQGGILGKQVELIFADTEGLPERGAAVVERLINNEKVVAIAGEAHSAVGLAELEVAHKYGIPIVFAETWSDAITETGYPEVFRIAPTSTMNSRASAEWLSAVGAKRMELNAENTDYGIGQAESDKVFHDELGITILDTIFVEPATADFQPILARIQAMDPAPDVIRVAITGVASYNLEQQMVDLGIAPSEKTIGAASTDAMAPEFWESVPNGNYYVFAYIGLPPSLYNDITRHVAEEYRKAFNTEPASDALEAYDSVWIIADAIKRAGTTESKAVIAALEETDIVLAQGRYWFKYTSKNPLPADGSVPAYMWHQWPDPAILFMQYFKPNQGWQDAAVIWPPAHQTHGTSYIPYGTKP